MNPSPDQIAEWTCKFKAGLKPNEINLINGAMSSEMHNKLQGYLRARTEQTAEIAELNRALLKSISEIVGYEEHVYQLKERLTCAEAEIAALKAQNKLLETVYATDEREFVRLNAKIAEILPLAKLAALMMKNVFPDDPELFAEWCKEAGCFDSEWNYTPNIEDTIEKLLKDENEY